AGYLAQIVTDYHRFGFFYIVPAGLLVAYAIERVWVLRAPTHEAARAAANDAPTRGASAAGAPPRRRFVLDPTVRRPLAFGMLSAGILFLVVDTATVPALARDETSFTRVGHDAAFLSAVQAIRGSGIHGGILTVAGADKWARGLTGENSYAPYSTDAYLFYPSQQVDSQLAYYALSAHYTLTNGLVAASIRATHSSQSDGTPDYSVYVLGTPREMLRIPPQDIRVTLHDAANGSTFSMGLTTDPTVTLPTDLGAPMDVRYAAPDFSLTIAVAVATESPEVVVDLAATSAAPYSVVAVAASVTPPAGGSALVYPSTVPGSFFWTGIGGFREPLTYGNVTPTSALVGATAYDAVSGGPAAKLEFVAGSANGSSMLSGQLALTTPAAVGYTSGLPGVLSTPTIWQELGVRFVLMRNESIGPTPYLNFAEEVPYLLDEYGLLELYQNPEWSALEIPASYGVVSSVTASAIGAGG
ncbi:MAG: hypothetical protein L3J91_01905, partial [Thermoplasmata archaeon]|nr:hypothetical protein [Thermoplasmata archaeon]